MNEPIETRDPEAIRAHKAKDGKAQWLYLGQWLRCDCTASTAYGIEGPALHRLLLKETS